MRKLYISLIFCFVIVISTSSFTYAQDSITETSNVKVFINATPRKFNDVPIVMNNRLLLPLRAVLTELGIPNDDDYIIWNGEEGSVRVKKDNISVYLKVGSTAVQVNKAQDQIDAPPVIYKNRVYIPVRFIAQSMGKKVAWDSLTTSVFIREEAEFNHIKDILTKSSDTMKELKRDIYTDNNYFELSSGTMVMSRQSMLTVKLDRENKVQYQKMDITDSTNMTSEFEMYIKDNILYQQSSNDFGWKKHTLKQEDIEAAFQYLGYVTDNICSALVEEKSNNSDEIVLKGNVCRGKEYTQGLDNNGISDYKINGSYMELHINKNNYQLVKAYTEYIGNAKMDGNPEFLFKSTEESTAPNGNFKVEKPSDF